MPELRCERDDCGIWFDVDQADVGEAVRCSACGQKQVADGDRTRATPTETQADATQIGEAATPDRQQDAGGTADQSIAVDGAARVTVTITIDVEPRE
jgi:hypothetical protein